MGIIFMVTHMRAHRDDDYTFTPSVYQHEPRDRNSIDRSIGKSLEVFVVFLDASGAEAALQMADRLAQKLGAHLRALWPFEVHYSLPLTKPPIPVEFLEGQIRDAAAKTHLEVAAQIYLCRDRNVTLRHLLPPNSLIVIGGRRRWWPTVEQKLSKALQDLGHHVLFAEQR